MHHGLEHERGVRFVIGGWLEDALIERPEERNGENDIFCLRPKIAPPGKIPDEPDEEGKSNDGGKKAAEKAEHLYAYAKQHESSHENENGVQQPVGWGKFGKPP